MDSHRRHELEQNSLYRALTRLPAFAAEYGAYILLGVAVVVAVYFYFSTQRTATLRERQAEAIGIFSMAATVENARGYRETVARFRSDLTPEQIASDIADRASEFEGYAMLPDTSQRPGIRSRALRLRGDFNWTVATFEHLLPPASTSQVQATQPATARAENLLTAEAYLSAAETAYREVLANHSEQMSDALVASFGLAAIAEQRGQFDGAAEHYDAILARDDASEGVKALARQRKNLLEILALSPRLARPLPTTLPATLPTTSPATQPADPSASPVNHPATQPESSEPPTAAPDDMPPTDPQPTAIADLSSKLHRHERGAWR